MRGDLGLMVKQQSVTGFNVKLTPMGLPIPLRRYPYADAPYGVSQPALPTVSGRSAVFWTKQCRVPYNLQQINSQ